MNPVRQRRALQRGRVDLVVTPEKWSTHQNDTIVPKHLFLK